MCAVCARVYYVLCPRARVCVCVCVCVHRGEVHGARLAEKKCKAHELLLTIQYGPNAPGMMAKSHGPTSSFAGSAVSRERPHIPPSNFKFLSESSTGPFV